MISPRCRDDDSIIIGTKQGYASRFLANVADLRPSGRASRGVKASHRVHHTRSLVHFVDDNQLIQQVQDAEHTYLHVVYPPPPPPSLSPPRRYPLFFNDYYFGQHKYLVVSRPERLRKLGGLETTR